VVGLASAGGSVREACEKRAFLVRSRQLETMSLPRKGQTDEDSRGQDSSEKR